MDKSVDMLYLTTNCVLHYNGKCNFDCDVYYSSYGCIRRHFVSCYTLQICCCLIITTNVTSTNAHIGVLSYRGVSCYGSLKIILLWQSGHYQGKRKQLSMWSLLCRTKDNPAMEVWTSSCYGNLCTSLLPGYVVFGLSYRGLSCYENLCLCRDRHSTSSISATCSGSSAG